MELGLRDKVILVAASSRGLGFGIAEAAAREGARISMASRDPAAIERAADSLRRQYSTDAKGYAVDVRERASIERWIAASVADFGHIDGLVTNAGGPPIGGFEAHDDATWESSFQLTLMSVVRMIRAVLPELRKSRGAIVTVTSSTVIEPSVPLTLSSALRAGIASLVKTLSLELADAGIRVNNLVPGRVNTDRLKEIDQHAAAKLGVDAGELSRREQSGIPMGRYGTIEEFGSAAAFLLSERATYITGTTLVVDGGKMKSV